MYIYIIYISALQTKLKVALLTLDCEILTGVTTPGQNEPGSNCNEGVLPSSYCSSSGASP